MKSDGPVSGCEEQVYLSRATPSHLPILRRWHAADPALERRLSSFYAAGDGWVKELVEHEERLGWLVYRAGQPASFVDLDVDPDEMLGHLALYVARAFRRQGTGLQSIGLVVREARRHKLKGLIAAVEEENEAASQLLEAAGFSLAGHETDQRLSAMSYRSRLYTLSLV